MSNNKSGMDIPLRQVEEWVWEVPQDFRKDMRVPARVFASASMLESIRKDRALWQLVNVATLPGILQYALAMPDIHEGYGFPIGGVAAMDWEEGVVSPGGIGYDINCGVRLVASQLKLEDVEKRIEALAQEIFRRIPAGVGKGGPIRLRKKEMDRVLEKGAYWAVEQGMGEEEDLRRIESGGRLEGADPDAVSSHAKERGADQLGTMGSGNHFVEVQYVERVFDEKLAHYLGLFKHQVVILIHTGSRGLGHQVATDYIRIMLGNLKRWGLNLPDRELACAPIQTPEAQQYLSAMKAAANFAFANRQVITHHLRQAWKSVFGKREGGELRIVYDVAHNIAKIETYEVNGSPRRVLVHRKGATRAFPPGHPEIPQEYRQAGQPVLIPGSMGTWSYVLVGTPQSMVISFGTTCHGAGRQMSRSKARKSVSAEELVQKLRNKKIVVRAHSRRGVSEEAPIAYKDVNEVVEVVHRVGIARKVARLRPLAVIKG